MTRLLSTVLELKTTRPLHALAIQMRRFIKLLAVVAAVAAAQKIRRSTNGNFKFRTILAILLGTACLLTSSLKAQEGVLGDRELKFEVPEGVTTPPHLQLDRPFQSGRKCGPNALYGLLQLQGISVRYEDVVAALPTSTVGVSLAQIQQASDQLGHRLRLRKDVTPDELDKEHLPAIVHLSVPPERGRDHAPIDHFLLLIDENHGKFVGLDTTNMMIVDYTKESIARNMTGFVAFSSTSSIVIWNRPLFFFGWTVVTICLGGEVLQRVRRQQRALA